MKLNRYFYRCQYLISLATDYVLLNNAILHWIQDHKEDFEIAVQKQLGKSNSVDWSDVRVICIAPNYKKYDLHAVQVMGANIELWKYCLFSDDSLYLEEVFHTTKSSAKSLTTIAGDYGNKTPIMVEAGKKAALAGATGVYTPSMSIWRVRVRIFSR